MSTVQMPERPVFNSLDPSLEAELAPPISSLAIVALVLGVLSLTAGLSVFIFPFAIFVAVLCAILIWRLSTDSTVSGIRLAQIGLFCSLLGGAWGVTTAKLTDTYYYSHASEHAKLFLQTLSAGKQYEAFELTQREPERQVTGTDIETHYKSIMATDYPVRTDMSKPEDMPSAETMKNSHAKEELVEFLDAASTKEVMTHGKDAKWNSSVVPECCERATTNIGSRW